MPETLQGKTILLVEDEAIIALGEAAVLEKHGCRTVIVHNGERAIEKVKTGEIDLILMDIDLGKGKMDGAETAKLILQNQDIPVVFLSNHSEPEIVAKTEIITSYGYVTKSGGTTALITSLKMAVRLYAAYRETEEKSRQLKTLLDNAEDFISRIDRQKHHLYVNKALCAAMNITGDLYRGKVTEELGFSPELSREWNAAADRVFETGKPFRFVYRLPAPEGERIMDCKIVPELIEDGTVKTAVAISRDITHCAASIRFPGNTDE